MAESASIPQIDISALFGTQTTDRDSVDAAVMRAASSSGFMTVHGFPGNDQLEPSGRAKLLQLFSIPDEAKLPLMRQNFRPQNPNVYRGWFPLQPGAVSYKEGIDMGPDIVAGRAAVCRRDDPLCEPTPLPAEELLPGWRKAAAEYYATTERVGRALMQSLAGHISPPVTVVLSPGSAGSLVALSLLSTTAISPSLK
jgi:isopenicillin N synthase-like dioxygenase